MKKVAKYILGWLIATIVMAVLMAGMFRAWDIEQQEHLAEIQQTKTWAYLNAEEMP